MRRRLTVGLVFLGVFVIVAMPVCAAELVTPLHADESLTARAKAGDSWAQLNLGAALDHGLAGYPQDRVAAVLWYRRAAIAGVAEAQFNLAHCLATGSGTPRNDSEAFDWMLKAAEQGLPSAQFLVGVMLAEGLGVAADLDRARLWLRQAAAAGNADAAVLLNRMKDRAAND